jgi:hypothetical protein
MKNKPKSARRGSKPAAVSQPKTSQSRANIRPTSLSPAIVLFQDHDGGVSEEGIDLSATEYAALKRAAAPTGDGILMFMANAALEKAGWPVKTVTCILMLPDGSEVARVDFPRQYFSRIEAAASRLGISLQQFFCNAIRNFIRSQAIARAA